MSSPALLVLAGPNGSGKSTYAELLVRRTRFSFINADVIAGRLWPGAEQEHAYEAARRAAAEREAAMTLRTSFIAETVFSHPSKLDLVGSAVGAGYFVDLHIMLVPEELAVARVAQRVDRGGHRVPEEKIRERYQRLWPLVRAAGTMAARTRYYDNSDVDAPFRRVAEFERGVPVGTPEWPRWTPAALLPSAAAT